MNALEAKSHLKFRPLLNLALVLAGFIVGVGVFASLSLSWVFDAALIGLAFYVYFFVLERQAVSLRCPSCHRVVEANTPWVCGFCQKRNDNVEKYPFVHRCEHCGAEPKAYQCHHRDCGELIFLSEDRLERNYARCVSRSFDEEQQAEIAEEQRQKRKLEHELNLAELTARLKGFQGKEEDKKSPRERMQEDFELHETKVMGVHELAREKKQRATELYGDDAEMLARANEMIDAWVAEHT